MNYRALLKQWVTSGAMFTGWFCGGLMGIILDAALNRGSSDMLMLIATGGALGALIALAVMSAIFQDKLRMCLLTGAVIGVIGFAGGVVLGAWPLGWFGL